MHSGWTMSTLVRQEGPLGTDMGNIKEQPPSFMTMPIPGGHPIQLDSFSIVDRESQGITRTIKEAMYIRVNDPPINMNLDKHQLPHIWGEVLQGMLSLHLQWYPPFTSLHILLGPPPSWGHTHISLVSWSYLECLSFLFSHIHIGAKFPTIILASKVGKYNIFPKTWRSIVSVDIVKACLFFKYCILFCYYIGDDIKYITHIDVWIKIL